MTTDIAAVQKEVATMKDWEIKAIKNRDEYDDAAIMIATCLDFIDQINEYWEPQIRSAYKTHKELCKKRDEMQKPIFTTMESIQQAVNKYTASRKTIESDVVVDGVKTVIVEKKHVEVIDKLELLKAIIEDKIPADCVGVVQSEINKLANVTNDIPGCKIITTTETVVRRGK